MKKLTVHKTEPQWAQGYQFVGFFQTEKGANEWVSASLKAGKEYPFWLQYKPSKHVGDYVLWRYKPRKGKVVGKGF